MQSFSSHLKQLREARGLMLREVAALLGVDLTLISKFETAERKPTRDQVSVLAKLYKTDEKELLIEYLTEKIVYEMQDEEYGIDVLKAAEKEIKYRKRAKTTV